MIRFPPFRRGETAARPRFVSASLLALVASGLLAAVPARADDDALRATLKNGLRVVIVRDPLAPVVTTEINYLAGSNEAPPGFPGMAHAQEHMMFRGSPGLSADQLAAVIAAMGGQFNADTQQTVTQYFFNLPAEDLDVALRVEALRMRGVLDSEELWSKERGAIEQEVVQDLSSPQYVFYTKLLAAMFAGTPWAHDALGTRESFDATTGAMLKRFHDAWYAPNDAILVVVGDVEPREALALVEARFADIPARQLPARPPFRLGTVQPQTLRLTTDLPYGMAVLSYRLPGTESPDYAAAQVLGDVLSSQRGDLYALVPRGKALYAGFSLDGMAAASVGSAIAAFPRGTDPEPLRRELEAILAAARKGGLPAELVEAAKRKAVADFEFRRNSVAGLAQSWSQALAVEGRSSPEDDVRAIERVTVEDVNRVARQALDPDHAVIAILTPSPSGAPVATRGYGGAESFAPEHPAAVALPPWAATALARATVPASTLHPVVRKLPNGLTLIVQPEPVHTVSVYGSVRTEPTLETAPGQDGVDDVLGQLFSWGTTSLDRLAFQKALDDIAADASAGADFSLRVLPDHFERGLELLADDLLHPALPRDAFETVRAQAARAAPGVLESADYLADRALKSALFPHDDPTLRQATAATLSSLTYDDVQAYYRKAFRPDLATLVVVGDVAPERVEAAVRRAFGGWRAEGPKPPTLLPAVPLSRPSVAVVPDASRVQDQVTLGETLNVGRTDPDYYALELGNHVLGGAFYATRLYRDLREKGGLVYFVDASLDVDQTRALYTVRFGCDPPRVAEARAIVVRDLEAMQREPVSATELRNAKALLLRQIPLSEASVSRVAMGLLYRAQHDLPLDEPTRAARRYVGMDAAEVRAAFARRLRPLALAQVTEGPTPP